MRPVDLTPEELRLGARPPMRTGPVPYIVLGAMAAVLIGIALLVTTSAQVSEAKEEVATVKQENVAAEAEAARLASYVHLQQLRETRTETIASLANSRFDWERVMRELALVLPHDVWLTNLGASASAGSGSGEGEGSELRSSIAGPALELQGCATGQDAVAGFVTALKEIDGVTRVGLEHAELSESGEGSSGEPGGEGSAGGECRTRDFISQFSLVVAFDAAPVPPTEGTEAEAAPEPTESAETTATETESSESTESTESGGE